jgi:hypothetical protein
MAALTEINFGYALSAGAADLAVAPFAWLAHVEHIDAARCELFCEIGGVGAGGSCEEAHGSGRGGVVEDAGELVAHLRCDRSELVVADDREHALGVDR